MGLFDTVICKYPLPIDTLPSWATSFHTQDFGCQMQTFTIHEDGRISSEEADYVRLSRDIEFGVSNFAASVKGRLYTSDGSPFCSLTFIAHFRDGIVQWITLAEEITKPAFHLKELPPERPDQPDGQPAARVAKEA